MIEGDSVGDQGITKSCWDLVFWSPAQFVGGTLGILAPAADVMIKITRQNAGTHENMSGDPVAHGRQHAQTPSLNIEPTHGVAHCLQFLGIINLG